MATLPMDVMVTDPGVAEATPTPAGVLQVDGQPQKEPGVLARLFAFADRKPSARPAAQARRLTIVVAKLPPPPVEMLVGTLPDARLQVVEPFLVKFTREGQTVGVCCEEFDTFGYGRDRGEALQDLTRTIAELYFSLGEQGLRLSAHLQSVYAKLQKHFRVRHA